MALRRPRWSDGGIVEFRFDRWAWQLNAISHGLHIITAVIVFWFLDQVGWWRLLAVVAVGTTFGTIANMRLHIAVKQAEGINHSEQGPVSLKWFAQVSAWRARALEWCAHRCELSERKLLAKAETASSWRAAKNYRRRAQRDRRWAELARTR